jgi:thymidylate synthase ThyX
MNEASDASGIKYSTAVAEYAPQRFTAGQSVETRSYGEEAVAAFDQRSPALVQAALHGPPRHEARSPAQKRCALLVRRQH